MTSNPLSAAKLLLIRHEGLKLRPYRDTVGKLTIGVGRNLDDVGITEAEALHLLANDIVKVSQQLMAQLPVYNQLDDTRKLALVDMGFMGVHKLLGFKGMIAALEAQDWEAASNHCLASKWATQVHGRANDIATMIRTGEIPDDILARAPKA